MPESHSYHDEEIVNAETRHETSDVDVKALLGFVVIFIVFAVITHIVLYLLFGYYRTIFRGHTNAPLTEIERPAGSDVPPEPRLQPFGAKDAKGVVPPPTAATPVVDMETMRHNEDEAQTNAAWIDQAQGRVRLPIDVAKQLAVQRLASGGVSGGQAPSAVAPASTQVPPPATQAKPATPDKYGNPKP